MSTPESGGKDDRNRDNSPEQGGRFSWSRTTAHFADRLDAHRAAAETRGVLGDIGEYVRVVEHVVHDPIEVPTAQYMASVATTYVISDLKGGRSVESMLDQSNNLTREEVNRIDEALVGHTNYISDVHKTGGVLSVARLQLDKAIYVPGKRQPVIHTAVRAARDGDVLPTPEVRKTGGEVPVIDALALSAQRAMELSRLAQLGLGQELASVKELKRSFGEILAASSGKHPALERLHDQAERAFRERDIHFFDAIRRLEPGHNTPNLEYLRDARDIPGVSPVAPWLRFKRDISSTGVYLPVREFRDAGAKAIYMTTGDAIFRSREDDEFQRWAASVHRDVQRGRENARFERAATREIDRLTQSQDDRGDGRDEPDDPSGGTAVLPPDPKDPLPPPPNAPRTPAPEQVREEHHREHGGIAPGDNVREHEPGEGGSADPEKGQTPTTERTETEEERQQRVKEARQQAIDLARAAERNNTQVAEDTSGKASTSRGVERDGPGLTPGEQFVRQAEIDARNPLVPETKSERKGFWTKVFKVKDRAKETRGPELGQSDGMRPLPARQAITPEVQAAHDKKVKTAEHLRERGIDPNRATTIAEGIFAGGKASQVYAATVAARAAQIRTERGIDPQGKGVSKALELEIQVQAEHQALDTVAQTTKAADAQRKQRSIDKAKEVRTLDERDPVPRHDSPSPEQLVAKGYLSLAEQEQRIAATAASIARARGIDTRDPKALQLARELAVQQLNDEQGVDRRRVANDSPGLSRGISREQGGR